MKGGKVVIDADRVIELLEEIRKDINEKIDKLGRFLARGLVTEQPSGIPRQELETEVGIPTDGWTSYATKGPAGPKEPSWRFASDREDNVYPEVEDLVDAIWEGGKVEQGGFVYTISRDGKFLQRRKVKK